MSVPTVAEEHKAWLLCLKCLLWHDYFVGEDLIKDPTLYLQHSGVLEIRDVNGQNLVGKWELHDGFSRLTPRQQDFANEVQLFNQLDDVPSVIVRLQSWIYVPFSVGFYTVGLYKRCIGGDLLSWKEVEGSIEDIRLYDEWVRNMLKAVGYLHGKGIAHNDLSLENFAICFDDDEGNYVSWGTVKLLDFGTACTCGSTSLPGVYDEPPSGLVRRCKPLYIPPEEYGPHPKPSSVRGRSPVQLADVWALAVCVYMLLFTQHPWGYSPGRREGERRLIDLAAYEQLAQGGVGQLLKWWQRDVQESWNYSQQQKDEWCEKQKRCKQEFQRWNRGGHLQHLSGMLRPSVTDRFSCQEAIDRLPKRQDYSTRPLVAFRTMVASERRSPPV